MSLQDSYQGAENLTSNGVQRRSFVTDFHDTLADFDGIKHDYFKALVVMHLSGHNVVIASALPEDVVRELNESPVVEGVLGDLGLSLDAKNSVMASFCDVLDKASLGAGLKSRGIEKRPDVFCDDYALMGALGEFYLDPFGDEFEGFCLLASADPDLALETLLKNPAALHVENEADVQRLIDNDGAMS